MNGAAAAWLTQQVLAADGSIDVAVLTQYGVLGIFAGLLVVFARVSYRRETERADRLEADNKRLNEAIQDRVMPAVLAAGRALEECAELLNAMQREREVATTRRYAQEDKP